MGVSSRAAAEATRLEPSAACAHQERHAMDRAWQKLVLWDGTSRRAESLAVLPVRLAFIRRLQRQQSVCPAALTQSMHRHQRQSDAKSARLGRSLSVETH